MNFGFGKVKNEPMSMKNKQSHEVKLVTPPKKTNTSKASPGVKQRNSHSADKTKKRLRVEPAKLPSDFADQVLDIELLIDKGEFDLDTINSLMLLYSQAVEYYNGINSNKYTYYEARIQNMLIRPEIF